MVCGSSPLTTTTPAPPTAHRKVQPAGLGGCQCQFLCGGLPRPPAQSSPRPPPPRNGGHVWPGHVSHGAQKTAELTGDGGRRRPTAFGELGVQQMVVGFRVKRERREPPKAYSNGKMKGDPSLNDGCKLMLLPTIASGNCMVCSGRDSEKRTSDVIFPPTRT